jgi:VanZ family protein
VHTRWRWAAVFAYMTLIFVLSSIPGRDMPMPGLWRMDKVVHAVAFAVLAALVYGAVPRVSVAVAVTTTYGVLDEVHQRFTPNRSADPADVLADFVGACVGAFAAHIGGRVWASRRRAR